MKNIMFLLVIIFSVTVVKADNENIYCGEGRNSYAVGEAAIALVAQDDDLAIYFDGADFTSQYNLSRTAMGYLITPKVVYDNSPMPSIAFKRCDDGSAQASFVGGVVSNQPFPCTCETN